MDILDVKITKSKGGWSVDSEVYWNGALTPARTGQGALTLAWALWHGLENATDPRNTTPLVVRSIIVNGAVMSKPEALAILQRKFGTGEVGYHIPAYAKALA